MHAHKRLQMSVFHEQQIAKFRKIRARSDDEQQTKTDAKKESRKLADLTDSLVAEAVGDRPNKLRLVTLASDIRTAMARFGLLADELFNLHEVQRQNMEAFVVNSIAHHMKNCDAQVDAISPDGCVSVEMSNGTMTHR